MNASFYRRAASALVGIALTATLAACATPSGTASDPAGQPSQSQTSETATPNDADVMFVGMMIPHHREAVEMADMLLEKDGVEPDVVELAEAIKAAQEPEIELMQGWLDEWDSMPAEGMGGMDHGDMDSMDHGGMMGMSEEDMQALEDASGAEASRLFLELMIVHHEGAIEMAQDVLDEGQHPDVRRLAEQIIDDQAAEIELMRQMLNA